MTAAFHLNNKGVDLGNQWFISRFSQVRGKNICVIKQHIPCQN